MVLMGYYAGGNVGIGVGTVTDPGESAVYTPATPPHRLSVYTGTNNDGISLYSTNTGYLTGTIYNTSDYGRLGLFDNTQTEYVSIGGNGTNDYINTGNPFGIGTTSPAASLDVEGSVKFGSAGTPGTGKVLTSDTAGNATWQPGVQVVTMSLSAAQIKDLPTTPIQILAAPGAGYFIQLIDCTVNFMYGTVEFDNTDNLILGNNPSSNNGPLYDNNNVQGNQSGYFQMIESTPNPGDIIPNTALYVFTGVPGTNSTVGDSTAKLYISYMILPV
jgi:hypothetical protein